MSQRRENDAETLTAALSYVANCGMPDGVASATAPADWPANGVCMDLFNVGELGGSKYVTLSYVAAHDGSGETLLLSENVDAGFWTDSRESSVGFVWSTGRTHRNGGRVSAEARILRINQQTGAGDASIRFSRPSSFHPTGVNVAYCDGRVAFLSECIDYVMFARMMTPDGAGIKYPGTDTPIGPPYRECP